MEKIKNDKISKKMRLKRDQKRFSTFMVSAIINAEWEYLWLQTNDQTHKDTLFVRFIGGWAMRSATAKEIRWLFQIIMKTTIA